MSLFFDAWKDNVLNGKPPTLWPVDDGNGPLSQFAIGPGRVVALGGAPGAGKSTLMMQLVFDALRNCPDLRAVVANVEMHPYQLVDKQLARYALVDIGAIQSRTLTADQREQVCGVIDGLRPLIDRMKFAEQPNDLLRTMREVKDFGADLLVLDYLQRIDPPAPKGGAKYPDKRSQVNALMGAARELASCNKGVMMLSAVSRPGYAAAKLGLSSYKESGDIDYGIDSGWLLARDGQMADCVTLRHVKERYGETADILLRFEAKYQRFLPPADPPPAATPAVNAKRRRQGDRT